MLTGTLRYDTGEVKNGLKSPTVSKKPVYLEKNLEAQ
jgi:hypothetical protein